MIMFGVKMGVIEGVEKGGEDVLAIGGLVEMLDLAGCRQQGTVNGQLEIELENETWRGDSGEDEKGVNSVGFGNRGR